MLQHVGKRRGATGFKLIDDPNPNGPFFYETRREPVLAIVVHITAGLDDADAIDDHSAERTADYAATTDRPVLWHDGVDTDTVVHLLPTEYTAFQCRGYNSCTVGVEVSKRTTDWRAMPAPWVTATLGNLVASVQPIAAKHSIPPRRATKAELDAARAHWRRTGEVRPVGYVAHADLDPGRRRDPGATFPWERFLGMLTAAPTIRRKSVHVVKIRNNPTLWVTDGVTRRWVRDDAELAELRAAGIVSSKVVTLRTSTIARIPLVGTKPPTA